MEIDYLYHNFLMKKIIEFTVITKVVIPSLYFVALGQIIQNDGKYAPHWARK